MIRSRFRVDLYRVFGSNTIEGLSFNDEAKFVEVFAKQLQSFAEDTSCIEITVVNVNDQGKQVAFTCGNKRDLRMFANYITVKYLIDGQLSIGCVHLTDEQLSQRKSALKADNNVVAEIKWYDFQTGKYVDGLKFIDW